MSMLDRPPTRTVSRVLMAVRAACVGVLAAEMTSTLRGAAVVGLLIFVILWITDEDLSR